MTPASRDERRSGPPAAALPLPGERRYWAVAVDLEGGRAWLDKFEAHHALRVMRLHRGDALEVIDGSGRLFEVEIEGKEPGPRGEQRLATRIRNVREPPEGESGFAGSRPWLAQALIRPARLEVLVDGATQLGLAGLVLFTSARTTSPARLGRERRDRLVRLMRVATTQSLGLRPPELKGPIPFAELPEALAGFQTWVAHGPASTFPPTAPSPWTGDRRALVVGPEGGLIDSEVEMLMRNGAKILDLGPRRLRSETAALVGLALLTASPGTSHHLGVIARESG